MAKAEAADAADISDGMSITRHNAIWTPPNVRRKLAEAKSSSAFCYKASVRRAARTVPAAMTTARILPSVRQATYSKRISAYKDRP